LEGSWDTKRESEREHTYCWGRELELRKLWEGGKIIQEKVC